MFSSDAFLVMDDGLAIRINDRYYGTTFTNRFFDSPAISWICMMVAFGPLMIRGGYPGGFFILTDSSGNSTDLSDD